MADLNPFASLVEENKKAPKKSLNLILEEIFGFTLDEDRAEKNGIIYIEEVSKSFKKNTLDLLILQHAIFDRLFMCCNKGHLINAKAKIKISNTDYYEDKAIIYLYKCYKRLENSKDLTREETLSIKNLIITNISTAFINSEIYDEQKLEEQLFKILKDSDNYCTDKFFTNICNSILETDGGGEKVLNEKTSNVIQCFVNEVIEKNLVTFDLNYFNVLKFLIKRQCCLNEILKTDVLFGSVYRNTPLGAILNISILPKTSIAPFEYFLDPTDLPGNASNENLLWNKTNTFLTQLYDIVFGILAKPNTVHLMVSWIGSVLRMNSDRRKLWTAHSNADPSSYINVSDGFMVNFSNLLLRLFRPICSNKNKKILKVDPTYCGISNEEQEKYNIHLPNMSDETYLLPHDNDEILVSETFTFTTECFFFVHKSLDLGYQVVFDKLMQLSQEIGRLERTYMETLTQNNVNANIKESLLKGMTEHLCLKSQLSDPIYLDLMFDFISTTCYWLCQIAVHVDFDESIKCYAPLKEIKITFPLPDKIPNTLKYIPEFIIENIISYLVFVKRYNEQLFEKYGAERLNPILTFILIYIGTADRIKNPHLRARLVEGLESLLPIEDSDLWKPLNTKERDLLFNQHEHRREIVKNLLSVFVNIEMTGQSVEFEQKFNYRRPMYTIMAYLWEFDEYKNDFVILANEAKLNMEAVSPPLFLRFINLLMNDAIYLLDEALTNIAKLKELQIARDNGEWDSLSVQERTQNISYMQHIGFIAKFDNILGRDTIKTLVKLTSKITNIFTHPTMVDRVASFLNYFLYNLVGPRKKDFKIKNQKDYNFEPANTVLDICKIYFNLKDSDEFCLAVSQDGRSYNPKLFTYAEDVLVRIGGVSLIVELKELAIKVAGKALKQQKTDELLLEAPEHFLDPIMSTLMKDPVILPSSKQTIDRTTIARHLLSDQTDPFNRAPLSMDQVIPNVELAEEIKKWLNEKQSKN